MLLPADKINRDEPIVKSAVPYKGILIEDGDISLASFDKVVMRSLSLVIEYMSNAIFNNQYANDVIESPTDICLKFPIGICRGYNDEFILCFAPIDADGLEYEVAREGYNNEGVEPADFIEAIQELMVEKGTRVVPISVDVTSNYYDKNNTSYLVDTSSKSFVVGNLSHEYDEMLAIKFDAGALRYHPNRNDNIPYHTHLVRCFYSRGHLSCNMNAHPLPIYSVNSPYRDPSTRTGVINDKIASDMREIASYVLSQENAYKIISNNIRTIGVLQVKISSRDEDGSMLHDYSTNNIIRGALSGSDESARMVVLTELKFTKDVERCLS